MRRVSFIAVCVSFALLPSLTAAHPLPGAPKCEIFPPNNPWNQKVAGLPVASDSAAVIASIGLGAAVHPGFGSGLYDGGPIGIPYAVVNNHTRRVPVSFTYSAQSDHGRYPLPPGVPIEGGYGSTGDRHVIVVDRDTCTDYELFAAYPHDGGRRWTAGSGAILTSARTTFGPLGGRRPTRPASRSSPASRATTRSTMA